MVLSSTLWDIVDPFKVLLLSLERIFYYYVGNFPSLLRYVKTQSGITEPDLIRNSCTMLLVQTEDSEIFGRSKQGARR